MIDQFVDRDQVFHVNAYGNAPSLRAETEANLGQGHFSKDIPINSTIKAHGIY